MLAGVGVLGGHRDPAVLPVHVVGGGRAVEAAAVGEAAPGGVHLREVGVVAPVAAVDQLQQPGPVRAGLGAENPCGGATLVTVLGDVGVRVGAHVVVLGGFVEARRRVRTASSSIVTTCGKASRKKPEIRTVTSIRGLPSSASGDRLEADDAARRVVPHRPNTQQRKHFGDVVARGAHRRRAPHRQADRPRPVTVVVAVARQQRIGHRATGFPGQPRRHRLRVDGVEVAAGGQHVDQAAQRRTRRSRRDEPAVEGPQDLVDLARGSREPGHHLGGGEPQDRGDIRVIGERVDDGGVPAGLLQCRQAARGRGSRRRRRPRGRRCRPRPGRAPAADPAPTARRRTAGGRAGWPAPGRVRTRRSAPGPSTCSPSRIWTSLISHSQPSTCSSMSSNESSSGRSSRPRSWSISAARISVQICWRIAGSLPGSSAAMLACSSSNCSNRAMSP